MKKLKCKICRKAGAKLFLKGERCFSQKCLVLKKPFLPGKSQNKRTKPLSEYGKELKEKQKLKNSYNLSEAQFRKYVVGILKKQAKVENPAEALIQKLENRLDNVAFRLGFASSRVQARQFVSHKHFFVNGKSLNIPSHELKIGDKINIRLESQKRGAFKNLSSSLKGHIVPSWLELNKEKLEGKIVGKPTLEEVNPSAELSIIFEFYSR